MTGSAVSQAIRRLEEWLCVPFVPRTTRSVQLTVDGERLTAAVRPELTAIHSAVTLVGEMASEPRGTIRLHVAAAAQTYLTSSRISGFLTQYPHVDLDLAFSDEPLDIVAKASMRESDSAK